MSVTTKVESRRRNKHMVIEVSLELEGECNFYVFEIVSEDNCVIIDLKGSEDPPREVYEHLWSRGVVIL